MRAVLIRDPDESAEMLRPDPEDWGGETISSLLQIPGLLDT
jgi:hypothetical protein